MIGDNIKNTRLSKGMSAKTLSELTGLTQAYLSMLESNKRKNPSTDALQSIADALGVSVNDLLDNGPSGNVVVPEEYTDKYIVTKKDKEQYAREMKKANEAFFLDDELSEEAKKEMLDLMSELFWKAKALNKKKK